MSRTGRVGKVIGTEQSTPLEWWAAVDPSTYIQLDDPVVTRRQLPGMDEPVSIYGVVGQVRAQQDGAKFDSDVFVDGIISDDISEAVQVHTTRIEPETYVPPLPMADVTLAQGKDRDKALFFDQMGRSKMPAGLSRDGNPVYLNFEFVNGMRGGHIHISGISGVATKTSYATFLLHSMFTSGVLGDKAANTKALVYSVKGEDLLFLDKENVRLDDEEHAGSREQYAKMGLPVSPFTSVGLWAPPKKGTSRLGADVATRHDRITPYFWTLYDFCRDEMLPYLFTEEQDERHQYSIVVSNVTAKLKHKAKQRPSGAVRIDGVDLASFEDLVRYIADQVEDEEDQSWSGRAVAGGTKQAFIRRLDSSARYVAHLIRGDVAPEDARQYRIDMNHQVTVVDLHRLHDRAQRFVVGVTLRSTFNSKESSGTREPLTLVVLDELNKYAPAHGMSPIKAILLDVAERGRSMGIILIGACQTSSEVERRIVSNSSIRVVGRLDPAEAARQEYAWLPASQRARAIILKPGTMLVSQPQIPVPVSIQFPFPAWATRSEEAAGSATSDVADTSGTDPFSGIT